MSRLLEQVARCSSDKFRHQQAFARVESEVNLDSSWE